MHQQKVFRSLVAVLVGFACSLQAADKNKSAPKEPASPSYDLPQPDKEKLDLQMYQRIREEALAHSHVM